MTHRHPAECEQQAALPFDRQCLPNRAGGTFDHRAIQASAPRRTMPATQAAGIRRVVSTLQRCFVWDIESGLRDTKDLRFGMGMGSVHVSTPERRDRLWLINGLAVVLLTLLGAASEPVGYDRMLKTNTSKRREHSLFRQGCMVYDLIPTMPERWLQPLMLAFTRLLGQQPLFSRTLGLV